MWPRGRIGTADYSAERLQNRKLYRTRETLSNCSLTEQKARKLDVIIPWLSVNEATQRGENNGAQLCLFPGQAHI